MLEHRDVALLPEDPGVYVALDDRVDLMRGVGKAGLLQQRVLLRVDQRVRRAIKHVMAEKSQRKRPPNALVLDWQVTHRGADVAKRLGNVAGVHIMREVTARGNACRDGAKAHKEGVWTLVAQQEGEQLLLAVDKALGKALRSVLAKDVMRYQRGHARAPWVRNAGRIRQPTVDANQAFRII